jgi:hypothetical protein
MNHSRYVILTFVAGFSFLLAACGGNTQSPTRQNATATGPVGGQAAGSFDHSALDGLLKTFVNDEGWVDYTGLQREPAKLDAYLATLGAAAPQSFSSDSECLAFWINAYNAFTLADVLDDVYKKAKGVKEVSGFFDKKRHRIAGADLTLDEIEKRGRDLKDARIHFAVNCASTSCPKLQRFAYTGAALEEQLTRISREFLNDPVRGMKIERGKNEVRLSSIFKWYAGDFTGSSSLLARVKAEVSGGEILEYVKKYAPEDTVKFINESKPAVKYLDYDWSLNAQETQLKA